MILKHRGSRESRLDRFSCICDTTQSLEKILVKFQTFLTASIQSLPFRRTTTSSSTFLQYSSSTWAASVNLDAPWSDSESSWPYGNEYWKLASHFTNLTNSISSKFSLEAVTNVICQSRAFLYAESALASWLHEVYTMSWVAESLHDTYSMLLL